MLEKLQSIFAGFENNGSEPLYILMGSFVSKPVSRSVGGREVVQAAFDALGDIISKFPGQAENAKFLLIPGGCCCCLNVLFGRDTRMMYTCGCCFVAVVLLMVMFECVVW